MFYALIMVLCSGGDCRPVDHPEKYSTMLSCLAAATFVQQEVKPEYLELATEVTCRRIEK